VQLQIPTHVVRAAVRAVLRPTLNGNIPHAVKRRLLVGITAAFPLPDGVVRLDETLGGVATERHIARAGVPTRAVLYLHGGGYEVGSPSTHRALCAHLAKESGADVFVPDYRLAPEHPYPAAVDDAFVAYRALLARGLRPESVAVAGDSAGGGLTLALVARLRSSGTPLPAALVLICPWLDLSLEDFPQRADDPVLVPDFMRRCAREYAGKALANPEVSPILMALDGLPKTLLQSSGDDLLRDQAERWIVRAAQAGADVEVQVFEDLWHVFQLHAGVMAKATSAVRDIGRFFQRTLA
jgi:epsilon-lactone hydrolase